MRGRGRLVKKFILVGLLSWTAVQAQTVWFTVMGEPANAALNTVQVDPVPIDVKDSVRTMRVRVSRSLDRTSWDGVPYRSYESIVQFDCVKNSARYLSITYFARPLGRPFFGDGGLCHRRAAPDAVPRRAAQSHAAHRQRGLRPRTLARRHSHSHARPTAMPAATSLG